MLLKATYTGVAASLIDGKTTHTIGMISNSSDNKSGEESLSAETRAKLQAFWKSIRYLLIDKISMIGKKFLARLSHNIAIGKMIEGKPPSPHSFGGLSIIKCGDFFQFPPVTGGEKEALYYPAPATENNERSKVGRLIYKEFTTVVTLKEQVRITNEEWRDFLQHLRFGQIQEHHVQMLRTLLVTHPTCVETDFSSKPWNDVALVTPCHTVRQLWNEAALGQHGQCTDNIIYQCHAEDTIKGKALTLTEHYAIATQGSNDGSRPKQKK